MIDRNAFDPAAAGRTQAETDTTLRCPKCGRAVTSVLCGHCGSRLSAEQADLYAAVVKKILKTGGDRTDATNKGGVPGEDGQTDLPGDRDGGGAAMPRRSFVLRDGTAARTAGDDDRTAEPPGSDEFYSPPWLVEAVRQVMGAIDLDPASSLAANETVRAAKIYTRETNGLENPWARRVFLNPPFSIGLRPWVEKLEAEIRAGRVEQAFVIGPTEMLAHLCNPWFRVLVAGSLLLPHKRIEFLKPDTGRWTGPRFGTFAAYCGGEQDRFVSVFGDKGRILQPVASAHEQDDSPDGPAGTNREST